MKNEEGLSMEMYMKLHAKAESNFKEAAKLKPIVLEHFKNNYCVKVGHPSSNGKASTSLVYYIVAPKNGCKGRGEGIGDMEWVKQVLSEIEDYDYTSEKFMMVIETCNEFTLSITGKLERNKYL